MIALLPLTGLLFVLQFSVARFVRKDSVAIFPPDRFGNAHKVSP